KVCSAALRMVARVRAPRAVLGAPGAARWRGVPVDGVLDGSADIRIWLYGMKHESVVSKANAEYRQSQRSANAKILGVFPHGETLSACGGIRFTPLEYDWFVMF